MVDSLFSMLLGLLSFVWLLICPLDALRGLSTLVYQRHPYLEPHSFLHWQMAGTTVCGLRSLLRPESIPSLSTPPSTDTNTIPIAFHSFFAIVPESFLKEP
ncbi:hypothetical protein L873DRAFT_173514 [Choiromyces venosus 120613-1]|uniref:Uncharacterized protein n=1 Tax=Choiromyces venosus 120613-1 TaxID=1336337 RepID=A0A3N4K2X9_9PEZI|nr:hypothetical protein L873DRAFT_173514 [Choiromyces venosus 120613-1]